MQRRTSVFLLGLFVFSLFMPFASSNHGQPHGMLMCWDIINEEDGCDIYSPTDDLSSFASDFVQSSYTFEMVDTSTINLQMNLAIHEFNRSTIGFDDITIKAPSNGLMGVMEKGDTEIYAYAQMGEESVLWSKTDAVFF